MKAAMQDNQCDLYESNVHCKQLLGTPQAAFRCKMYLSADCDLCSYASPTVAAAPTCRRTSILRQ